MKRCASSVAVVWSEVGSEGRESSKRKRKRRKCRIGGERVKKWQNDISNNKKEEEEEQEKKDEEEKAN